MNAEGDPVAGVDRLVGPVREALSTLQEGADVVVAVSGGPDSVALLHLVAAARPDLRLVVGHVRHGLRDDAPDAEAAAANAKAVGADWVEQPVAVGQGEGPEDAARRARLDALADLVGSRGATAVLLGHTADDQAETVLLRIARGTGVDGLAGMRPRSVRNGVMLLRPMLGLRRSAVHKLAADHPHVADPSNTEDPDQRRGRARREALPALGRLRPDEGDPVPALVRLAELAAGDAALASLVATSRPPHRFGMAVVVPIPRVGTGPGMGPVAAQAWARRTLRSGWLLLPGEHLPLPSAEGIERAITLPAGASTEVEGGVRVDRAAVGWVLRRAGFERLPEIGLREGQPVEIPGHRMTYTMHTAFDAAGRPREIRHEVPRDGGGVASDQGPAEPPWLADLAPPPAGVDGLVVRGRAPEGDRAARRALQRIPEPLRDQVPLVCAVDGTVLMAGSEVLAPPPAGQAGIRIEARPAEPSGYPPRT